MEMLRRFGRNELPSSGNEKRGNCCLLLLKAQTGILQIILWLGAILCLLAHIFQERGGQTNLAMCIMICIVNFMLGMVHFWSARKEDQGESFSEDIAASCEPAECIRDGKAKTIDARDIVPGDIVLVEANKKIPADIVLFECNQGMKVNLSALTGEAGDQRRDA